jgi:hypothetical protein
LRRRPDGQHDDTCRQHAERNQGYEQVSGTSAQLLVKELGAQRDARERVDDE